MLSDSIQHQAVACGIVQRALEGDRVPHAYVFHGPDGVGKERFSRVLASILLAHDEGAADPWETVDRHPDFHLVYRQLNRQHSDPDVRRRKATTLGIDVVREFLIAQVGLKPLHGIAKVFVIRECEKLQAQAQQALLKTLEEPPPRTFLILLTTSLNALLSTIMSRCQVVPFGPLPDEFVRSRLLDHHPGLAEEEITFYTRLAEGSAGRAIHMVNQELFRLGQGVVAGLSDLRAETSDGMIKVLSDAADELSERCRKDDPDISATESTRRGLITVFHIMSRWYADLLRHAVGASSGNMLGGNMLGGDMLGGNLLGGSVVRDFPARRALHAIRRVSAAGYEISRNVNTMLCLETLVHDLGRLRNGQRSRG